MTEQLETSSNELAIRDILDNPIVQDRFVRMYKVGTKMLQESGFAVYNDAASSVSELVVPKIDLSRGDFYENEKAAGHVDLSSLVDNEPAKISKKMLARYFGHSDELLPLDILTDMQRLQVEKIMASTKMNQTQKIAYANRIIESRATDKFITGAPRTDVAFIAHNHPQRPHISQTNLQKKSKPSEQDMESLGAIQQYNPLLSEGVVASNGKEHVLSLYRYTTERIGRINRMTSRVVPVFVTLSLNDEGKLAGDSEDKLAEFEASHIH